MKKGRRLPAGPFLLRILEPDDFRSNREAIRSKVIRL
jgi:hypothetical protein